MSVRLTSVKPATSLPTGTAPPSPPPPRECGQGQVRALTGNDAVALAFKQVDPHLTAAYPIAPQTELMHKIAEFIADGQVRTRLLTAESEYAAMSAVLGAAAAGCRTFTATSAHGLAHMMEVYQNMAALRLPTVLALVNRHAAGLLNIHNDHSDAMLARNAAWIQMHAENAQEAYDNVLQAFRIAEDDRVRLPVTVCHDGFIVSHTMERLLTLTDAEAGSFVGEFIPPVDLLDVDNPRAVGPLVPPHFAPVFYAQISEAMRWAPDVIEEIGKEYGLLTGRSYGLVDAYRMDDAEVAVVAMGSVCGTVRAVVDLLRSAGVRAGLVKLRVFRPFPAEALAGALRADKLQAVAVLDKTPDLGSGGPLFAETTTALALHARAGSGRLPLLTNIVLGIGGRDITTADIAGVYRHLLEIARLGVQPAGDPVFFMNDGADEGESFARICTRGQAAPDTQDRSNDADRGFRHIVLLGRGGQGVRITSYLLAEVMIQAGRYAQAYPTHGPERTGAPVHGFIKISDRPIDDRQQIYAADMMVVFDETLLELCRSDLHCLVPGGVLIVNTPRDAEQVQQQIGLPDRKIRTLDATGIAMSELSEGRPNMALMGALTALLQPAELDGLKRAFRARMKRLSEKAVQGSLRAIDRAVREMNGETR